MKREKKFLGLVLALFMVILWGMTPPGVNASTYSLTYGNVAFSGGPPYASVELTLGTDWAQFVITTMVEGTLGGFGFNTDLALTASNFTTYPTAWTTSTSHQMDGFGKFDWFIGNSAEAYRVTTATIILTGLTSPTAANFEIFSEGGAGNGNQWFAAHLFQTGVTGYIAGNGYGTPPPPVPEPTTLLLMGLGLMGLGALKRRCV